MKLRGIFVLALSGFALATKPATPFMTTKPLLDGKIIGGTPIDISAVPYQVSIFYRLKHMCGGSIITKTKVLSAAHCTAYSNIAFYGIRAGSSSSTTGGTLFAILNYLRHPLFDGITLDYDLAIFTISGNFIYGPTVNVIGYTTSEASAGTLAQVSGWGSVVSGGATQAQLRAVNVTVINRKICATNYTNAGGITVSMICASSPGKDSCQGDSGGPLTAVIKKKVTQIGIVSWGNGCAVAGYPGVYTNLGLAAVNSWITSIIASTG